MKGPTVPNRKLALLPLAFAAAALSACTITVGEDEPGETTEEAAVQTVESSESPEASPAPTESGSAASLEVPAETVATAAEDALEPVIGSRPDIDCGELTLVIFVDRQTYCTLIDPATGDEYEVTMTVTSIEGDSFDFDVEVADEPR